MKKNNGNKEASGAAERKAAEQLRKNFIAELKHFRAAVHQTLASFQIKLEGEIEQVIELFANRKIGVSDSEMAESRKIIEDMVGGLKRLKLKANKGRKKDIRRIEQVIDELREKTDIIT